MRFSDTSPELRSRDEERRQANARLRSDSGLDDQISVTTPSVQRRLYGGRAAEQLVSVDRGFAAGAACERVRAPATFTNKNHANLPEGTSERRRLD